MALQESTVIYINTDPEHGTTLSYQAECNDGSESSKADCSHEVVQRSGVLTEVIATSEGGQCTTRLPVRCDVFSAWHGYNAQKTPSVQTLCDILQVRSAQLDITPAETLDSDAPSQHLYSPLSCCRTGQGQWV